MSKPRLIMSVEFSGSDLPKSAVATRTASIKTLLTKPEEKPIVASKKGRNIDNEKVKIFQAESARKKFTSANKAVIGRKNARYWAISFLVTLKERFFREPVLRASKIAKIMAVTASMMRIGLE
jgi:hypothetical protein